MTTAERNRDYYVRNRKKVRAQQARRHKSLSKKAKRDIRVRLQANYHVRRKKQPWENLVSHARARAKKKRLASDLTMQWVKDRWTGRCELTGIPFEIVADKAGPFSPSIDRIKPELGYVRENCRLVLFCVNAFKGIMTDQQLRKVARKLV